VKIQNLKSLASSREKFRELINMTLQQTRLILSSSITITALCGAVYGEQPHLDRAVTRIRQQVGWFGEKPTKYSKEFLCAVATMNYVQSEVSPLRYSLLVRDRKKLPTNPEEYLSSRAGICGGQVMTFREILTRLKIRNRPVEFYLRGATPAENQSHIGADVFYAGEWHFFDITWGTFFRPRDGRADDVLSIDEVLKTENVAELAITNASNLWFQQWTAAGLDPFEYINAREKDVIVGRNGVINIRPNINPEKKQVYTPTHQPNYVGRNNRSSDYGSLSFRLGDVNKKVNQCTITIIGKAGDGWLVVQANSGETKIAFSKLKTGDQTIDLADLSIEGELHISVSSAERRGIGYVVIKQISVETSSRH